METLQTSPFRRLIGLLLLPLFFFLTACEMHANINVNEDNTAAVDMTFSVEKELLPGNVSCDDLAKQMEDEMGEGGTVTDQSDDKNFACKMSTPAQPFDKLDEKTFKITREGDDFVVNVKPEGQLDDAQAMMGAIDASVSFTFPGAVKKVDTSIPESDYQISGNTVKFTNMNFYENETTITANATTGGGSSTMWWILGIVALLIIAAIIAVVLMKKKKPATAQQQAPGAQAPSFDGSNNPYAAPTNQAGAAPYGTPQDAPAPYGAPQQGSAPYGAPQDGSAPYGAPQDGSAPQAGPYDAPTGGPVPPAAPQANDPGTQTPYQGQHGQPDDQQPPHQS